LNLYDEFFMIIRSFNLAGLKYVVIGGIAMAFHDTPRFTRDIASKDDIVWLKRHRDSEQDRVDIKRLKNDED